MPETPTLAGRRVLVVAATFPNRFQPWMLNTTIQALRHSAEVFIAAGGRRGETYQAGVLHHGLLARTIYVKPTTPLGSLRPIGYLFSTSPELRHAARLGLARALSLRSRLDLRSTGKRLALAVPLGLPALSLVHSHSMTLGYEFLRVAEAHEIPFVQTFHGLPPAGVDGLPADKMDRLFRKAARILVNTKAAKRQLTDRGCAADKIQILPQGTDLGNFPYEPQPYPELQPVRFLSVGRLHEDKGHIYALRALARLSQRGMNFLYRIVGTGSQRPILEQEATRLGIRDSVTFTGEVDDEALQREYRSAHLFLFPSLRDSTGRHVETQGVAMQEAQASGCIVIAARTGGIPESVDETHTRLVPDRDPDALAGAISSVMQHPESWRDWQDAGRRWVEDRYAIDVIGQRLAELYARVIDEASSPHAVKANYRR